VIINFCQYKKNREKVINLSDRKKSKKPDILSFDNIVSVAAQSAIGISADQLAGKLNTTIEMIRLIQDVSIVCKERSNGNMIEYFYNLKLASDELQQVVVD
jgi:ribosome-binding protein aMBF1 (putative translation factor)